MTFVFGGINLSGEITEVNEISTIQNSVTNDSLVLFNVSGTLYAPSTTLADNQWRLYFTERVNAIVIDKEDAEMLINKIKNEIVSYLPKKPVEEFTPQLIESLQNQQIPVLGITQKHMSTSYAESFGLITKNHLLSIGVDLEKTLSYLKVNMDSDENYSFAYGLIFTNKKPVGPAILSFLNRIEDKPTEIIMIDNSLENLENAQLALALTDIKFKGFRYGRADELKTNFDPIIGNIQFFAFINDRKIMSDEEAKQIKDANPDVNYSSLLDSYIFMNSLKIVIDIERHGKFDQ